MLFGGVFLFIGTFLFEDTYLQLTSVSVFVIIWLIFMATIVQFAVWYYLLQKNDPGKTSAFLFLAPFFGVVSGWILLDETLQWYVGLGGLLIFIGIFLVNWKSGRSK